MLDTLALVSASLPQAIAVIVGDGFAANPSFEAAIRARGLGDRLRCIGVRHDMERVYTGFDVLVLSSRSEGMPNVLMEARLGYEDVHNPERKQPHMGIDESGKGDFFGPMVIAGAYINEELFDKLRDAQVI